MATGQLFYSNLSKQRRDAVFPLTDSINLKVNVEVENIYSNKHCNLPVFNMNVMQLIEILELYVLDAYN